MMQGDMSPSRALVGDGGFPPVSSPRLHQAAQASPSASLGTSGTCCVTFTFQRSEAACSVLLRNLSSSQANKKSSQPFSELLGFGIILLHICARDGSYFLLL